MLNMYMYTTAVFRGLTERTRSLHQQLAAGNLRAEAPRRPARPEYATRAATPVQENIGETREGHVSASTTSTAEDRCRLKQLNATPRLPSSCRY